MSDTLLFTLIALVLAIWIDFRLMAWLRKLLRRPHAGWETSGPGVRVFGHLSPVLTWLRYGRLPQLESNLAPGASRTAPSPPHPAPQARTPATWSRPLLAAGGRLAQRASDWFGNKGERAGELAPQRTDTAALGLGMALLLMASAQWALARNWETYLTIGLLGYAVAIVAFLWSSRAVGEPAPAPAFVAVRPPRRRPRLTPWLTVLVLALYPALNVNAELSPFQDRILIIIWLLSVGVFTGSVLRAVHWEWPRPAALAAGLRVGWREALAVAAIGLLGLAARTYDLELHPYSFVNDEAEVGEQALEIMHGLRTNWFEAGWSGQPIWSFVPTAASVMLFGNTAFAARLVSAVQGALGVIFIYRLAREAFDRPTGLLAAGVLATLPWHVHFSRLGVNNVIDSFFASGVLWLTYRALRRGRIPDYLWAGLAVGLTLYTYLGSRLVMALALGTMAYAVLRQRDFLRAHFNHLLVFFGALIIVAAPQAIYFSRHADLFMGRINSEAILVNGWLQRAAADTGRNYFDLLREQFLNSTLIFVARDGPGHFFGTPRPYLTWLGAIFFVLGLASTAWRLKETRYMMILAWFWSVVILGSTLTLGPPSHQRLIMAAPAAALLVALGLRETARLARLAGLLSARAGLALSAVVAVVVSVQGIAFYFGEYRTGHYFEDPSNELAYEATTFAVELGPDYRLFLLGHPSVYSGFGMFRYLSPEANTLDFNTVTEETLAELPRDRGAFFVAVPSRVADLEWVAEHVPGGRWIEVPRRYQGPEPVYYAYLVSPEQFAAQGQGGS